MNLEKRIFDISLWCFAGVWLLVLLTSCSAAVPLSTVPTSKPTAMATEYTVTSPHETLTSAPQTCTVQTGVPSGYLNLRTGAGTNYGVVRVVNEGEILTVLKVATWLEVSDRQGNQGYINSKFCK
jgi:uncharacterized protein YgiM (DUF1202 family)